MIMHRIIAKLLLTVMPLLLLANLSQAAEANYRINPGDILLVLVWNEDSLNQNPEILVRPDGYINFPLAGEIEAAGQTPGQLEGKLADALSDYLKDRPTVTVSLRQLSGNKIYVLGKVQRPGEYPLNRPTDVMQALALGGGLTTYAAENSISVLRRDENGQQQAIEFEYGEVKDGDALETNILLRAGDVVVVP